MITLEEMVKYDLAYRIGEPQISDAEWDRLVIETGYKETIHDQLLAKSDNGRTRVPMKTPLASLRKYYRFDKLKDWLTANFKEGEKFVVEPKLDGNAINISYNVLDDGTTTLRYIGSPGDGLASMIVFPNALDDVIMRGVPKTLTKEEVDIYRNNDAIIDGIIENRGEVIIDRKAWSEANPGFKYETWRQMVAAIMCRQIGSSWTTVRQRLIPRDFSLTNSKDENKKIFAALGLIKPLKELGYDKVTYADNDFYVGETKISDLLPTLNSKIRCYDEILDVVTYSCSTKEGNKDADFLREITSLKTFKDYTFSTMDESFDPCTCRLVADISEIDKIEDYCNKFFCGSEPLRNSGVYQCDGLVFKPKNAADKDMFKTRNGGLAHDPSNMIALKIMPETVETTILDIWSETTKKGNVTMHAKIEPVTYLGSTIENINLFNQNWVEKRKDWLYVGATIKVTFSGDLIPVIMPA